MSCDYCNLKKAVERNGGQSFGGMLVGDYAFTKDADLTHHSSGRVSLWYDFDDAEWCLLVLIDDESISRIAGTRLLPSCVQFHPKVCPFCGRKLQDPKWLWRLEAREPEHGLWYDGGGKWVYDVGRLGCSTKDLPMSYDWRYQQDGLDWWSSCSNRSDLTHWYSKDDAERLVSDGFVFTRYHATEYHEYEHETVFLKETCLAREELTIEQVYG